MRRAAAIIEGSPNAQARLAYLGDKRFLFSPNDLAFVMYGVRGRSWVSLGDPVGPESEVPVAVRLFWEVCSAHGARMIFYGVGKRFLPLYLEYGLSLYKIGEEAVIWLDRFTSSGGAFQKFRQLSHALERRGVRFELVPAARMAGCLGELRHVSESWLARKRTREKGFSMGYFDERYLRRFRAAVVRQGDSVLGFVNLLDGAGKRELSGDLIRYRAEIGFDVMDYLFFQLLTRAKSEGYERFNMGLAPLAGLRGSPYSPRWNRFGSFLFHHSEYFYHFEGLRRYKEKFHPEWRPRYLASPGGLALPRALADVAVLISRGLKGVIAK